MSRTPTLLICILLALSLPPLAAAGPVASDGDRDGVSAAAFGTLYGPTTILGDVFAVGTGLRNQGTGTVLVTGFTGAAIRAYVYWELEEFSPSAGANVVTFNGVPVGGVLLGTDGSCSGTSYRSWAYRADVTPLVTGPGAYTIKVKTGSTLGTAPSATDPAPHSNGASLVVVGATPTAHEVVIVDGHQMVPPDATVTVPRVAPGIGPSRLTVLGGDGQSSITGESMFWNGVLFATHTWDGSDPQSIPSFPGGNLWDTDSFTLSSVVPTNTLRIHVKTDCIAPEAVTLSTPVEPPVIPPPCRMTGEAWMVNATVFPAPVGPTYVWSERTGPVDTNRTEHFGPTAMAHVQGPVVNGYAWGSEIFTYAEPRCESYSRASVAHLEGGSNLPPSLLPLEVRAVEVWSGSDCNATRGGTTIGYLKVGGNVLIDTTGAPAPNTVLLSGPVTVIVNEQRWTPFSGGSKFEVNAVRIFVNGVADIKLIGAVSDIHECPGEGRQPPGNPQCPPGSTGTPPACVSPTCPPPTTGTWPVCSPGGGSCPPGSVGVPPACVVPPTPTCPPPSTGTWPNCHVIVPSCPPGRVGVPPVCVSPRCPPGTEGTFPDCTITLEECPAGTTGYPPVCLPILSPRCPPPSTGTFPDCTVNVNLCEITVIVCIVVPEPCDPPNLGVEPDCLIVNAREPCMPTARSCFDPAALARALEPEGGAEA